MEIKKKITIQFTTIVAFLLIGLFTLVYILVSSFRKEEFKERLSNKALSVAQAITETESTELDLLEKIEKNNPVSLPNEKIMVYDQDNQLIYSRGLRLDDTFSASLISEMRSVESKYENYGDKELFGCYYKGSTKSVVVICSAYDVFGYRKLFNLRIILIVVLFLSLALLYFLGKIFATRALRPVTDMVKQVNEIDVDNLRERISAGTGKDEIAQLGNTFNNMLDKLEISFKTQKDFIINASHELKTPLTSLTGNLEVTLLKERKNEEYKHILVSTLDDVKNLNKLINQLLILLRMVTTMHDTSFAEIRIDDILWQARSFHLKKNSKHKIIISFDKSIQNEDNLKLSGLHDLLKIAFLNLIDNGCKYSSNHKIEIYLAMKDGSLNITFKDEGIGIPKHEIENICQPFYRASNVKNRRGHGIGLSLVERIVTLHQGTMNISSFLKKGTTITLLFPKS